MEKTLKSAENQIEHQIEALLGRMTLKEKVSLLSGKDVWNTVPVERLGIPSLTMTDGPHGVRASVPEGGRVAAPTSAFPTGVAIAASWDPELVERVGAALAEETLAMGCDILLGPCVNIVRHPLAGRNFESYGEDPFLSGRIGVAYVKGVQSRGVGTSLKHFACNNQEFERNRGSSVVDERTLREIYLAQFETIVKEAHPWTVMCSYNRLNGVYASQNHHLLTDILKGEWNYDGAVVSDWGANHTIFESVTGGLDLEMPGPAKYYGSLLVDAVNNWQVPESVIDQAVRRLLRLLARVAKIGPGSLPGSRTGSVNTPEHQQLARRLAEQSITLLKNEGALLPIRPEKTQTLAVIGLNAAQITISGGGSAIVTPPYKVSPLDGLKSRLGSTVEIVYEPGCDNFDDIPAIHLDWLSLPDGSGPGLKGEFFNNSNLAGVPALGRNDRKIDFWWFSKGPTGEDKFSARWTGRLTVPESGRYAIQLNNSATARLFLNDQLTLESSAGEQTMFTPATTSKFVQLAGGQAYLLRIEFSKPGDEEFAHISLQCAYMPPQKEDERLERAVAAARASDMAVVFVGMPEGFETEGHDRPHMDLPGRQVELVQAVARANPRTVVVVNAGAPVSMPWIAEVPAVLLAYYPGLEGGNAIASVLAGDVNPSGKLPVTMPRRLQDTPAFNNYPGGREVHYGEGIFVGYRHYDQRGVEPLFPFGHGLSYTTFEYSHLVVPSTLKAGEPWQVTLSVKNTGSRPGQEVVQLYIHDRISSLPRPPKELKGFRKIALEPGETRQVAFHLDERSLAFYDPYQARWTVEPGEFEILVGSSSRDIRVNGIVTVSE
jgi:beta-glucosidase